MKCKTYLVQVVRTLKRSLATVAIIGGMLFVNVFSKPCFRTEYPSAVFTSIPVFVLFVLQAKLAVMARPSSVAPAAFDLVCMGVAVVKVLPKALRFEGTATAVIHCGRRLKLKE